MESRQSIRWKSDEPLGWKSGGALCEKFIFPRTIEGKPTVMVQNWEESIPRAFLSFQTATLESWASLSKIHLITQEIGSLKNRLAKLEQDQPFFVPIDSLYPEPYSVHKTIQAVVRKTGDQYIAAFFDANISASGDTESESMLNLKDMIAAAYETLILHEVDKLGPMMRTQLGVLENHIRAID